MENIEGKGKIAQGAKKPTQVKVHSFVCEELTKMHTTLSYDDNGWVKNLHFFNDLGFDSLDFIELVIITEMRLGINIPDEELNKSYFLHNYMQTVVSIIDEQ